MNTKMMLIAAVAACGLMAEVNTVKIRAAVPFAFDAKGVQMPAGKYEVVRGDRHGYVTLRNLETGKRIAMAAGAMSDNKPGMHSLEFKRYDGVFFLSAVDFQGNGKKMSLQISRREKEMAIAIRPETVIARGE